MKDRRPHLSPERFKTSMPRFVVLRHETPPEYARGPHWDLMLEAGGVLRTWALAQAPDAVPEQLAEALNDHRLAYLDYEGPISRERGSVTRWDRGVYEWIEQSQHELHVEFRGAKLVGRAKLARSAEQPDRWTLSRDER